MSAVPVIVYAFDPVEELDHARGLLVLSAELAGRLAAEHRVEVVGEHIHASLRFVEGSAAHAAAREALRAARAARTPTPGVRPRKVARLEG